MQAIVGASLPSETQQDVLHFNSGGGETGLTFRITYPLD